MLNIIREIKYILNKPDEAIDARGRGRKTIREKRRQDRQDRQKKLLRDRPKTGKEKKSSPDEKSGHTQGSKRGQPVGTKRKGRLPAKLIRNKAGKLQTVYYRPDKKTRSKYIDPSAETIGGLIDQYAESFKRMLTYDHTANSGYSQERKKGEENKAWGNDINTKLDALMDKYGITDANSFDKIFDNLVKNDPEALDALLSDAQDIYKDLYSTGDRTPKNFLDNIFNVTKYKLHTKYNADEIRKALEERGMREKDRSTGTSPTVTKTKGLTGKPGGAITTGTGDGDDQITKSTGIPAKKPHRKSQDRRSRQTGRGRKTKLSPNKKRSVMKRLETHKIMR